MIPLIDRVRSNRGILRLLKLDVLRDMLKEPCGDTSIRARIASEITVRAWLLAGGAPWGSLPERASIEEGWSRYGLDASEVAALSGWLSGEYPMRSYAMSALRGQISDVLFLGTLTRDLGNWETAQGVVPFVAIHEGLSILSDVVLLPFITAEIAGAAITIVQAADGKPLEGLEEGAERARRALAECGALQHDRGLRVTLVTLTDPGPDVTLNGHSLGLPVIISHYLRHRACHPRCLTVGSSGCLGPGGRLDSSLVDSTSLASKAVCLDRCGVALSIMPEGCAAGGEDVRSWPTDKSLCEVLQKLLGEVLGLPASLRMSVHGIDSLEHVDGRLRGIEFGMRFGALPASIALAEITLIKQHLEIKRDVRSRHLLAGASGLQAAALCHMGRTLESRAVAGELVAIGKEIGCQYAAEALVRQAVNMTDFADYAMAVTYCDDAQKLSENLSILERADMQLEAVSTKAQALMYWGLINHRRVEESLILTRKSVEMARDLDGETPTEGRKNVPRNLAYLYLWHALHVPAEAASIENMVREAACSDAKTWPYFLRTRWLVAYRGARAGTPVDWMRHEFELPDQKDDEGWLLALALKYRGTLRASAGRLDEALDDFRGAISMMQLVESKPLLAFISATAAVQEGELLMNQFGAEVRDHLEKSLDVFRLMANWFNAPEISAARWIERVEGLLSGCPPASLPDPQRGFPY